MKKDSNDSARNYFSSQAAAWRSDATAERILSVIAQRNAVVLDAAKVMRRPIYALDVGCGTGELVLELAMAGANAVGLDFADEMIRLSESKKAELGLKSASFILGSITDYTAPAAAFDIISAQGLVEYIEPEQTERFMANSRDWLKPEGRLVISVRNRLFNIVSLNDFTAMERHLGTVDSLIREALALVGASDMATAIAAAEDSAFADPPPANHPITGVPLSPRYQYTPGQMIVFCRKHGLNPLELHNIHYHAFNPSFARAHHDLHAATAALIDAQARMDTRLLPSCSSFSIVAARM